MMLSRLGLGLTANRGGGGAAPSAVGALALLSGETDGFASDFTYSDNTKRVAKRVASVNTEYDPDAFYSNGGTSPKLVYNSAGTLVWSPHNMFIQSDDATNVAWTKSGLTAPNSGEIRETATTAEHYYVHTGAMTGIIGASFTITAEVKPVGGRTYCLLTITDASSKRSFFDLTGSGSVVSNATGNTSTITLLADGYYRISTSRTVDAASLFNSLATSSDGSTISFLGDTSKGLLVRKMQYNRGTVPTAYLATTSAARYGLAIDHDPVTLAGKGLLVEPAATNLCVRSSEFGTAPWDVSGTATITANSTAGPNGVVEADTITFGASAAHQRFVAGALTAVTHTLSVFAKTASGTKQFRLKYYNGTVDAYSSDFIATTTWQRFEFSFTGNTASNGNYAINNGSAGAAGDLIVWGAQLETGSVASSVVPTFATTVARAAKQPNFATSAIPFSATVGTLYIKARTPKAAGTNVLWQIDDGTANERIRIERNASNEIRCIITDGGVEQANLNLGAVAHDTVFQVTFGWEAGSFAASLNGGAVVTDAAGTLPTVTTMRAGYSATGEQWNSHIQKVAHAPRRVANGDLPTWRYAA